MSLNVKSLIRFFTLRIEFRKIFVKRNERLQLIESIAVELQAKMTTKQINTFLSGFSVKHEDVHFVESKRIYVSGLLSVVKDSVVLEIAKEMNLPGADTMGIEINSNLPQKNQRVHRNYYSARSKQKKSAEEQLQRVLSRFYALYLEFDRCGFFAEAFGQQCFDGNIDGSLGNNPIQAVSLIIENEKIWPIETQYKTYSESDFFDVVEFLFDQVSKPIDGIFHDYNQCGWHFQKFNKRLGQEEYRTDVNAILIDYLEGFALSELGEVYRLGTKEMEDLFKVDIPSDDLDGIVIKVESAKSKFRRYRSSEDDRKDAVRELGDVLEYLRPKIKTALDKEDDSALFNIINNFAIRHHNQKQKINYDKNIWLSWMFHFYLATIHAVLRLIQKNEEFVTKC